MSSQTVPDTLRRLTALVLGGFLAIVLPAAAEDTIKPEDVKTWTTTIDGKEYSVRTSTPTYEGDTGLFHLSSAYTLQKGKFSFSLFRDNLDRDPKDLDLSIHGFNLAYGVTDRLQLFGNVGVQNRLRTDAPTQAGFFNDLPFAGTGSESEHWTTGFGDVKVGLKYGILDDYRGDGVGLAIKVLAKLPTADEEKGLGTGKFSGGADLILSKHFNRKADIHASIGYEINSDPDGIDIGNALKWGVGLNLPACRMFALQAELTGRKYGDSDSNFEQTNPMDFVIGPVIWLKGGFFIRPAVSVNVNFDDRGLDSSLSSKAGKQIAIGYHPGTPCCQVAAPPPPPPPPPSNRPPTVTLDCAKDTVIAGETTPCHAAASDPDGDPLTYAWTASAGRLTGSGADTTLDTTAVPCGTDIVVTVTVADGRSGSASARDTVKVRCPETKVEVQTLCTSSGFPRNLSRLNNVDKACLDDVASRLKADPRARVVVIGHADSGERFPEVIARTRAESIRTYLVKERGIEDARISVRSAAATKPLDSGTSATARAKNRRVEVVFVPEGAVAPEND
jgi:outer membrane protein OmpA-like peptidoglycan-associated protein